VKIRVPSLVAAKGRAKKIRGLYNLAAAKGRAKYFLIINV
jgi:hypothetical protein